MIRRKNHKTDRRAGAKAQRRTRTPLTAHRVFAPMLGLWGAALGGLVVLVLPQGPVLVGAGSLGLGALGLLGRFALAGAAALLLGGVLFVRARALTRKARRLDNAPSLAVMAMRHVRTIDPANELGSSSLDEPVESMPFAPAGTPFKAEAEPDDVRVSQTDDLPPPRMLDLAQFAAMPGRNAVWVEDEDAFAVPADPVTAFQSAPEPDWEPESSPTALPAMPRPASPSAIERLRAVPPRELSLIQMVERFAAALHEHQAAAERRGDHAGLDGRDAALAQALKALAAFSPEGRQGEPENEPLRDALARLQELRGAA